ncbi:uncharacterized protein LOC120678859 isoform X3 [Panicum virgatum]|uniref:uncharacterized protein LOC120678859 isoform X3 n=1 Tax=Panicum virgatum TaxID=38727 RepID=UPI0019D67373|nr:uncharacterized protein LOC120678859 isoform X3 [Panicum virgatum]
MPPAAAASCPLLRRAPAAPFAALSGALSRSGMARRLVAASAGGGGRAPAYGGLLLDAGGTLLQVARPVAETYASIGRRYGVTKPEKGIMEGFKRAFSAPWPKTLRYQGDGRPFWRIVVAEATNCTDDDYFEEVYQYYAHGDAWRLPVGADTTLRELKDAGDQIGVEATNAVHVGDDETADKAGANAIGLECWLWGADVKTFSEIRDRILTTDDPQ